jgi:hypothetical protein
MSRNPFLSLSIFSYMILGGRVIDATTSQPISDVNLQIATREGLPVSSQVWQTDSDGYFEIDVPVTVQPALVFTRAAYERTVVQPEDFYNGLYISLTRTGELTEVTVTATIKKKLSWFEWLVIGGISGKVLYDSSK